jgi:hypothetical protein
VAIVPTPPFAKGQDEEQGVDEVTDYWFWQRYDAMAYEGKAHLTGDISFEGQVLAQDLSMKPQDHDWAVWGDVREPLFVGTEQDAKSHYTALPANEKERAYLTDPKGNNHIYDEVTDEWRPA